VTTLGDSIQSAVDYTLSSGFKTDMDSIGEQMVLDIQDIYSTKVIPHTTSYSFLIENLHPASPALDSGTLAYYLVSGISLGFDEAQSQAQTYLTVGTPPPSSPFPYHVGTASPIITLEMNVGVSGIPMVPPTPFPITSAATAILTGVENFLSSKYLSPA
jgi:hypothetical protein